MTLEVATGVLGRMHASLCEEGQGVYPHELATGLGERSTRRGALMHDTQMAGHGDSTRAILFALGANFAITAAKGMAAFVSGSGAMLAETVHSLADCGKQGLLLLGMKQSKAPPSPDYPLGYGKAIYFWSFLVAVMLFSIGGMFSLYEGIHKLSHPEPLKSWWWAVGVLVFSIAAESVSMRACVIEVNKARGARSFRQWFRESRLAVDFAGRASSETGERQSGL